MNIVEPIFAQCKNKPAELALSAPGTDFNLVSYARLERCVDNICRRVISAGVAAGNRVAVFIGDPIFHAMVLLGLTKLGIVTISGRKRSFLWPFTVDAVITDKPSEFSVRTILAELDWVSGENEASVPVHKSAPDDLCRIFLTFGTSGEEKGIAITNRMLATRIEHQKWFLGRHSAFCWRTYLDLPLTTSLGFQVLLATLWRGGALVMTGDSEKTIQALPIYKIQNMVTSAAGLFNFIEMVEGWPAYGCDLQAVFCGGAISESVIDRFRARICSNVTTGHVAVDATMVASMPAHFTSKTVGAVGYVLPGVSVEIIDDNGRPLSPGQPGKVRIQSEYGVSGYLEDPQETERLFRNGWLESGEIGQITHDNMLVIPTRARTFLDLAGEEIDPTLIEKVLLMHANVVECCVLTAHNESGFDELCAFIVPRSYLEVQSLRAFCQARLPGSLMPVRFIAVTNLPKDAIGKVDRAAVSKLAKSGFEKIEQVRPTRIA